MYSRWLTHPLQKKKKMFLVLWVFQPILEKWLLAKNQLTNSSFGTGSSLWNLDIQSCGHMFIAEEASNLDEDTTMEVEDNHPVEDIEVTYKTDEDSIQDALKELFIQEENLRKLTEEVKKSIDIKDSNAKNDTASVV